MLEDSVDATSMNDDVCTRPEDSVAVNSATVVDANLDTSQSVTSNDVGFSDGDENATGNDESVAEPGSTSNDSAKPTIPDVELALHNSMVSSSVATSSDSLSIRADNKCRDIIEQGVPTSSIQGVIVNTEDDSLNQA